MSELNQLDSDLNSMILGGQALEAFEKYYADDVVMQENSEEPRVGKDTNRKYEEQFFGSIKEFHGAELRSSVVGDGVSLSEWMFDVTFQDGNRVQIEQAVRRTWNGDKVTHERFYHP
ncbi:MAG: nuclear transport factor 2 family protein [Myxococcales bacterium]|nr:nuclear transport factor 2 family protein [Myxococcales bacterium]